MSQNICKHKKNLLSLHKRVLPSPSRALKPLPLATFGGSPLKPHPRATFGGLPLPLWRGVNGLGY